MTFRTFTIVIAVILTACASVPRYAAPFAEVDGNADGVIEWREFATFYPDADPKAFLEADADKDAGVTREEWWSYIESQGS